MDIFPWLKTGAGLALICTVWWDFIATAMTASKSGPVSRRVAHVMWRGFLRVGRLIQSDRLLATAGPLIVVSLILLWTGITWAGWSLVYAAHPGAIVDASSGNPADAFASVYFVGFNLTTLGTGDYRPAEGLWQLMSVLTSFNGMVLITLSVTYAIPVVQAAAVKRAVAQQIAVMGATPADVIAGWAKDESWRAAEYSISALTPQILDLAQKHLAYPTLHYFHAPEASSSLPVELAVLDEALRGLPLEAYRANTALWVAEEGCSKAVSVFLLNLADAFVKPAANEPAESLPPEPARPANRQRELEHPTGGDRRKLLLAIIEQDGRRWESVTRSP